MSTSLSSVLSITFGVNYQYLNFVNRNLLIVSICQFVNVSRGRVGVALRHAVSCWPLAIGSPLATLHCSASAIQTSLIAFGLIAALAFQRCRLCRLNIYPRSGYQKKPIANSQQLIAIPQKGQKLTANS